MNQNMENDSNHFWKLSKYNALLYSIILDYIIEIFYFIIWLYDIIKLCGFNL